MFCQRPPVRSDLCEGLQRKDVQTYNEPYTYFFTNFPDSLGSEENIFTKYIPTAIPSILKLLV